MPRSPRYQLITFDVYTALFDIEGSLAPVVSQVLHAPSGALDLVRNWRRKQMEYALISNSLGQGRVPFRLITRRALDYVLTQMQIDLAETMRQQLVLAWDELQLWPEAGEVLTAVTKRGYPVGVPSNGDEMVLRALAERLPVSCDYIFDSERAGSYKPNPGVYQLPLQALGLAPDEVLHVAGSATDVMGAKAAGLTCAWSNRNRDRALDVALAADYEFGDLRGLLEVL